MKQIHDYLRPGEPVVVVVVVVVVVAVVASCRRMKIAEERKEDRLTHVN